MKHRVGLSDFEEKVQGLWCDFCGMRHAVALNYGNKFIIVYVAWEPKYQPAHKDTV